jgi:hypothetical protein
MDVTTSDTAGAPAHMTGVVVGAISTSRVIGAEWLDWQLAQANIINGIYVNVLCSCMKT